MKKWMLPLLASAAATIAGGLPLGVAVAGLSVLFVKAAPMMARFGRWQRWMMAFAACAGVSALASGLPAAVCMVIAGVLATAFTVEFDELAGMPAAAYGVMALCCAISLLVPEAADAKTLGSAVGAVKTTMQQVSDTAPYIGYTIGIGYGGAGLVEVVKSKNGGQGDFGDGMKKVLIGGGVAGVTGIVQMAAGSMGVSTEMKTSTVTAP